MAYVKCVHGEAACRLGRINMDANRSSGSSQAFTVNARQYFVSLVIAGSLAAAVVPRISDGLNSISHAPNTDTSLLGGFDGPFFT
jgi:hypothetical protein